MISKVAPSSYCEDHDHEEHEYRDDDDGYADRQSEHPLPPLVARGEASFVFGDAGDSV